MMKNGSEMSAKWVPNDHFECIDEHLGPQKGPWLTKLQAKVAPWWAQEAPGVQKRTQKVPKCFQKGTQNGSKAVQKTFQISF